MQFLLLRYDLLSFLVQIAFLTFNLGLLQIDFVFIFVSEAFHLLGDVDKILRLLCSLGFCLLELFSMTLCSQEPLFLTINERCLNVFPMLVFEVINFFVFLQSEFLKIIFKFIGFISVSMFQTLYLIQMLLVVSIDFSLVPFLELLDVIFIIIFFILHQLFLSIKLSADFLYFSCILLLDFLVVEVILLN